METIKGLTELTAKLNKLSKTTAKMTQATARVHAQAKALAPVNTGNLAGSIHMDVTEKENEVIGRVYTNVSYAPYVEFGTGSKGQGTYRYKITGFTLSYRATSWTYTPDEGETFYRTRGQVAQPYMYPALKQNRKWIRELFKQELQGRIK